MRGRTPHRLAVALIAGGAAVLCAAQAAQAAPGRGFQSHGSPGRYAPAPAPQPWTPPTSSPTPPRYAPAPSAPAAPARSAWQPATRQTATKQATRQASTKQASSKPAPRTSSSSSKSSSGGKSKACSALELPTLTSGSGSGLVGYVAATGDTHDAACGVGATTRVAVASVVTLSTSAGKEIAQIAVDRGDLFRFSLVPGSYRLSVRVPGSKGRDDCGGVLKVTAGHTTQATCVVGLG